MYLHNKHEDNKKDYLLTMMFSKNSSSWVNKNSPCKVN